MRWWLAIATLVVVVGACESRSSPLTDEEPARVCEQILDDWEDAIAGLSVCEIDADCTIVGEPEGCFDTVVISRNCGTAVNGDLYEASGALRLESEHRANFCISVSASGCDLPQRAACIAGTCRIVEWSACPQSSCGGWRCSRCNPVTQQGCSAGEKCATKVEWAEPFEAMTTCVPNGTVPPGGACSATEPGTAPDQGIDDCMAQADLGYECVDGTCTEVCTQFPDNCQRGICLIDRDRFRDIEGAGLCMLPCDPVAQDCANSEDGCYWSVDADTAGCTTPIPEVLDRTQDDPCLVVSGQCLIEGCAPGYQAVATSTPDSTQIICTKACTPAPTDAASTQSPAGIEDAALGQYSCASPDTAPVPGPDATPNDQYQCRFLNSLSADASGAPDSVGVCVNKADWGDCTQQQTADCVADPNPPDPLPPTHPCATVVPGCLPAGMQPEL